MWIGCDRFLLIGLNVSVCVDWFPTGVDRFSIGDYRFSNDVDRC